MLYKASNPPSSQENSVTWPGLSSARDMPSAFLPLLHPKGLGSSCGVRQQTPLPLHTGLSLSGPAYIFLLF